MNSHPLGHRGMVFHITFLLRTFEFQIPGIEPGTWCMPRLLFTTELYSPPPVVIFVVLLSMFICFSFFLIILINCEGSACRILYANKKMGTQCLSCPSWVIIICLYSNFPGKTYPSLILAEASNVEINNKRIAFGSIWYLKICLF